jgi:hypothetical protein
MKFVQQREKKTTNIREFSFFLQLPITLSVSLAAYILREISPGRGEQIGNRGKI